MFSLTTGFCFVLIWFLFFSVLLLLMHDKGIEMGLPGLHVAAYGAGPTACRAGNGTVPARVCRLGEALRVSVAVVWTAAPGPGAPALVAPSHGEGVEEPGGTEALTLHRQPSCPLRQIWRETPAGRALSGGSVGTGSEC